MSSRMRVLAVDDEGGVLVAIARLLSRHYDLVTLDDPEEVLRRVGDGERWDVVLCDMRMPVMSGLELNDRVAAIDPDQAARFIFFTATTREQDRALDVGGRDNPWLAKPASGVDMRAAIDRMFASRGPAAR